MPRQRRWKRVSAATQALLAMSPDEHGCLDFKQNIQTLTDEYLAIMANAAALADERHATVLVGVAEQRESGVTSARIVGLADDLHQAAETISQRASMTRPSPVRVEVFEENVSSKPILRVEITPTFPPHHDQRGRRATRQHSTTRAMSDEEILKLLEAREQRRYAGVAEDTASLMMGDFRVVTDEVLKSIEEQAFESGGSFDELRSRIDQLEEQLEERLGGTFDELWSRIDYLEEQLGQVLRLVDVDAASPMEDTLRAVVRARGIALTRIAIRIDDLTDADIEALERVLNSALDPLRYVQNERELMAWYDLFELGFEEGGDMAAAVQKLVDTHERSDSVDPISVREVAARFDREVRPPKQPRKPSKRRPRSPREEIQDTPRADGAKEGPRPAGER